jgi:hypothetical protein
MTIIKLISCCATLLALGACGSSTGAECVAAGGACVLGGGPCQGTEGPQSCVSAPYNPGGGFCCLPCPSGKTPNDAGGSYVGVSGCH